MDGAPEDVQAPVEVAIERPRPVRTSVRSFRNDPSRGGHARDDQPTMDPLFEVPATPRHRPMRPPVDAGLPIAAYSDDQLDDLVAWIVSDGAARSDEDLAAALRAELRLIKRGSRVDAAVNGAVRRSR